MWERSRNQSGEITLDSASEVNYTYEIRQDMYSGRTCCWHCPQCDKGFRKKRHLQSHLESGVHESKRYHCQGCGRKFKTLGDLAGHHESSVCSTRSKRLVNVLIRDSQIATGTKMIADGRSQYPEAILQFDGATEGGNPGNGGYGYVIYECDNQERKIGCLDSSFGYIDSYTTNNEAEYEGLIRGLSRCLQMGIKRLSVQGDSQLVIRQMNGRYKVDKMEEKYEKAQSFVRMFHVCTFSHIYREDNSKADYLAKCGAQDYYIDYSSDESF